jgi:copper homeostasis protein
MITVVRENLTIDLHVMIRPRGGDFCYSRREFDVMKRDIAAAKNLGANGVVFGLINLDGGVDVERTRELVETAQPLSITFHRAFDMCRDLPRALESLISCGVNRVLTSGGEAMALDGKGMLADLVNLARGRISVMVGGGVRKENVAEILRATGAREVHAGLRSRTPSPMRFRNRQISFGPAALDEYDRVIVREEDVRDFVQQLGGL